MLIRLRFCVMLTSLWSSFVLISQWKFASNWAKFYCHFHIHATSGWLRGPRQISVWNFTWVVDWVTDRISLLGDSLNSPGFGYLAEWFLLKSDQCQSWLSLLLLLLLLFHQLSDYRYVIFLAQHLYMLSCLCRIGSLLTRLLGGTIL